MPDITDLLNRWHHGDRGASPASVDATPPTQRESALGGRPWTAVKSAFAHLGAHYQRTSNPAAACAPFRRGLAIVDAANRPQSLKSLRQKMLEFLRDELTKCS